MKLNEIVALLNVKLAGESLSFREAVPFLNLAIDDINAKLNTIYPTFSEMQSFQTEYTCFPDKYIRTVVVAGAAWYYYVMDEEGSPTAQQYQMDYNKNLFLMMRDMLYSIPEEYQADSLQGTVNTSFDTKGQQNGIFVHPRNLLE